MSTTNGSQYKHRNCNGRSIFCNGECTRCTRAEVIFSNKNTTHNGGPIIHIVKRQGWK